MKKILKFISNNKGLIIFYILLVLFLILQVHMVEKNNNKITQAKNKEISVNLVG